MTACYGIACASHAQCVRYHAIEREWDKRIASCETWDHRYPLFELIPTTARNAPTDSEGGEAD